MLRVKIKQSIACFQIPEIGNPILSYPLVPPSTVFGLLRYVCNYAPINYENTRIAISGHYESKIRHILRYHITGMSDKGKYKTNIIPTEELYNVEHIIHIDSSRDYEDMIKNNIHRSTRLGRKEDLISSIECSEVRPLELSTDDLDYTNVNTQDYIYIPFERYRDIDALSIFRISLDSDKPSLDNGYMKMHRLKVLFLRVNSYLNKVERVSCSQDEQGRYYIFEWLT
jgi:CRISPR-associated protein Cas5t